MANVKEDLLQKLSSDKYYAEIELVRLANDPNMNYADKINELSDIIGNIALINLKGDLTGQYFQEAPAEGEPEGEPEAPTNTPEPTPKPAPDNVVEQPQASHNE